MITLRRFPALVSALLLASSALAQTITTAPQDQAVAPGGSVTFTVAATGTPPLSYQWYLNGVPVTGGVGATLNVTDAQPAKAGVYTVEVRSGTAVATSSALLGISSTAKVIGAGTEFAADIRHPTGNVYDQVLLQGTAATITADPGQVTRISYVDLNDDIVQLEFAGAGALTVILDNASGPTPPLKYNQPTVSYMKGHAGVVIAGADETTNVSIFSVGRGNAVNAALFRSDVTYDGLADLAFVGIHSRNGKFGGLRAANASFFATRGTTGVFAPGAQFTGPTFVGDINAFETATPVLLLGAGTDVRITGGDLRQTNAKAVRISGVTRLVFSDGSTSHGTLLTARVNRATLEQAGVDVTTQVAVNPVQPNASVYFAQLRPGASAAGSTASGYAAITITSEDTALVSVNISNLSSAQTAAYLRIAGSDDYLLRLPTGQVTERTWTFAPVGTFTRAAILTALNEGRLYVSLETARYPTGEVSGSLITAAGSQNFTAPAAAPALPAALLASPSDIDAARLLAQATFGPTDASIADVRRLGVNEWIRAQMALPTTSLLAALREDATKFPNPLARPDGQPHPRATFYVNQPLAWWKNALTAPDQLRQRVAFALSELFVIASDEDSRTEPFAHYYDVLATNAFGNFRTLLEGVTMHPEMAWYLTYLRNQKADPVKGTSPDENYAREVQQLFTVGLVQLQPDGTLLLDPEGRPIPTYDNITITETAKVFTGWAYQNQSDQFFRDPYNDAGGYSNTALFSDTNGRMQPLKAYEAYHDKTEKRVISLQQKWPREAAPTVIAANQTAPADLRILLDTLFNHPNTGPFVSKQLIQRLVTSNPSAGYVYRVAQAFANNGRGVRGDLGAVVTAILTDYEARSPEVLANQGFGKVKEPLIRLASVLRVLKTAAPNGRFADSYFYDPRTSDKFYMYNPRLLWAASDITVLGQAPLRSPSVFNFFSPYYSPPGALDDAGLVAPEMQITDSTYSMKVPNALTRVIYLDPPTVANAPTPSPFLRNDFTDLLQLSPDAPALVERLNLLLAGGQMSAAAKASILEMVESIPVVPALANTATPTTTAVAINQSDAFLVAPKVAAFDPAGAFTMEMWVFPSVKTGQYSTWLMGKRGDFDGDPWRHFSLELQGYDGDATRQNKLSFAVSTGTASTTRSVTSPTAVPVAKWTHVAGVYEGTTARLFINGVQVAQVTNILGPPKAVPDVAFSIGNGVRTNGTGAWTSFEGYVSQPRFWNVARTAAQIAQGMNEAQPSDRAGLVAGWLLNEGAGLTAADYSGNGRSLTRGATQPTAPAWAPTNGRSLDRVQVGLHLTVLAPDSALQK